MALVSPGVEVNVIDESFYTPAAAGTVPMIFVASASNKTRSSGTGTAIGTLKANAGKPYLVTSQRELGETFGDPLFYSDNNGNMIHGGELNEYGLQAAYSALGVSNRAYVVRADLDLAELTASASAPGGEPSNGAYWMDTSTSNYGILQWDAAGISTPGGQSFASQERTVITVVTDLVNEAVNNIPKASIGAIGNYAIDANDTMNRLYYKSAGNTAAGVAAGEWVEVGSDDWKNSWATVRGTVVNPTLVSGNNFKINTDYTIVLSGTTPASLVADINGEVPGVTAAIVDSVVVIYADSTSASDGTIADGKVLLEAGDTGTPLTTLGIAVGTYSSPRLEAAPHTSVPAFKSGDTVPAPTGSVWIKTTTPNGGANLSVKQYSTATQLWSAVTTPIYTTPEGALYNLDRTGGGSNLLTGALYAKVNVDELANPIGNYKVFSRATVGATTVTGSVITADIARNGTAYSFTILETRVGKTNYWPRSLDETTEAPATISIQAAGGANDVELFAAAINAVGLVNVVALVDSQNRLVIQHKLGGEIKLVDGTGTPLTVLGFSGNTTNMYVGPNATGLVASNWKPLGYTASGTAPLNLTAQGQLWYNSVVDEVDILVHNGDTWVGLNYTGGDGLSNISSPYSGTDANGPQVAATEPTKQSDGTTPLVTGDIWISTADIENYPTIYRYNQTLDAASQPIGWILLDKADQTTENGVLFADARYGDTGGTVDDAPSATIAELLISDYLDTDAPDPALYPKGMLLWNLRKSGFNVKRFERNYVDTAAKNVRQGGVDAGASMAAYYPHRWVTDSANQEDGSGSFGRHAQRKSVTQALQALVNSNQEIRDEESRQFNLIACPGYPELIGEMITLNYDRRLTAFVIGDTPFRLTPDATSLNEWATNVRLAVEDNDNGAVSFDEYMAMYYGSGFTSDNAGNNVVVPPSHMALRTIILNDQVAFPWFAPAGTRRGGVTNATSSGYISSEGEFVSVALNTGQRDTLYSNAINPITFISGAGLVVFGQKTRARNASALDRVNVARLTVYLRGQLELLAKPYLFEPNDKITRDQVKAAADALLLELVALRALYDFLVVCDESNNTPSRIDRNELYLDIAIEPVKAIEFIYIPLRIKNTGEIAALG
jgi:hypothetical protein